MPSLLSKSREHGELQDMYRRTLAASWVAQPGVVQLFCTLSTNQPLTRDHRNCEPTTVSRTSSPAVMAGVHISTTSNTTTTSTLAAMKTSPAQPISPQQSTLPNHRGHQKALFCTAITAMSAKKAYNPTDAKVSTARPKTILLAIQASTALSEAEVVFISKP